MRRTFNLIEYADNIRDEILRDEHKEWFIPTKRSFINSKMKFINGNLDPYSFQNMSNHVQLDNPVFNDSFKDALALCNHIRSLINTANPFGRMCIWGVPPRAVITSHVDDHAYHRCVNRWCYFITNSAEESKVIIGDETINPEVGTLFEFKPATEIHSFQNLSDNVWYFLSFDIWESSGLATILPADGKEIQFLSSH